MNTTTANNTNGKVFARVVMLMAQNPYTDKWEPMAYFPDMDWDWAGKNKASYMHDGQHGPCCEAFALLECKVPQQRDMKAVAALAAELRDRGYVLTNVDAAEFLASKGKRIKEMKDNYNELMNDKVNTDKMTEINRANGAKRRAARAAA